MTAFGDLLAFQRKTEALSAVAERLGWDQETMMPAGAAEQRGEEMAALEGVIHARRTDPRIGEWLAAITPATPEEKAQTRLIAHSYARQTRVPGRLAEALARLCSTAQGVWAAARASNDVKPFLPVLADLLALKREEAACYASGGTPYDALLDGFEPGETGASIAAMFTRMRPRLVALRDRVLAAEPCDALQGTFDAQGQMTLARELAAVFGYDFNHGRLDLAVHPFSSGFGRDVRITTRVDERDPFNCFYSTIHEVGHASYELGIDPAFAMTPVGRGASMGVHESQSRIYENQLGRSRAFAGWLHDRMQAVFGTSGAPDANAFYRSMNRVRRGFIRTESDEVQYNLHVMLRFDLERAMIGGDLGVADLEAAWNDRFLADFGVQVDVPSNGLLQDVHWASGAFGYFPTYCLGNVYAGCLHQTLRRDIPDLDTQMAEGNLAFATSWLHDKVQSHGGLYEPREIITRAVGVAPSEGPLLDYLEAKFGTLYGV